MSILRRVFTRSRNQRLALRDHVIEDSAVFLIERFERRRFSFQGAALHGVHFDADFVEQSRELGPLHDDADRPRDRVATRYDVVGAKSGDVGGRRRDRAELRNDWLLLRDVAQVSIDRFAAGRRPARAVDEQNDAFDVVSIRELTSTVRFACGPR